MTLRKKFSATPNTPNICRFSADPPKPKFVLGDLEEKVFGQARH
jgi:hypothetical protein